MESYGVVLGVKTGFFIVRAVVGRPLSMQHSTRTFLAACLRKQVSRACAIEPPWEWSTPSYWTGRNGYLTVLFSSALM